MPEDMEATVARALLVGALAMLEEQLVHATSVVQTLRRDAFNTLPRQALPRLERMLARAAEFLAVASESSESPGLRKEDGDA